MPCRVVQFAARGQMRGGAGPGRLEVCRNKGANRSSSTGLVLYPKLWSTREMDELKNKVDAAADAENPPALLATEKAIQKKQGRQGKVADRGSKSHLRAIKRLNEHLEDRDMVARDRAAQEGIFQSSTIIFTGIAVSMGGASYVALMIRDSDTSYGKALVLFIFLSIFVGAAALAAILFDLINMNARGFKTSMEAMDGFLKATRSRRYGRSWSMLSPTARKERITTPNLGILPVEKKTITLRTPADFEQYIKSFWRSPGGNYLFRSHLHLVEEKDDVAVVKVEAIFRRERLWLIALSCSVAYFSMGFVPIGVFLAMAFGGRSHEVDYLKTLIRGSNGFWYMYSGDFFESINEEPRSASDTE